MELITVVVPVYNVFPFLETCILSLCHQSYQKLEILLIDDGSTDGSGALCDDYARKDDRIRVIHQENRGLGAARNEGIRRANGVYIAFVDSDDWVSPTMIQELYQALKEQGAQLAVCDAYVISEQGRVQKKMQNSLPVGMAIQLTSLPRLLLQPHVAWNKLYQKDLFDDPDIQYPARAWYEDFRVTTKLYTKTERIVFVDRPLYYYRLREGSIQNNGNLMRKREKIEAMEDILRYYQKHHLFSQYQKELEFLAILNVYYTPIMELIRIDPKHPLISEFSHYIKKRFPHYADNPYIKTLHWKKRLMFQLLQHGHLSFIRALFWGKQRCSRFLKGRKNLLYPIKEDA